MCEDGLKAPWVLRKCVGRYDEGRCLELLRLLGIIANNGEISKGQAELTTAVSSSARLLPVRQAFFPETQLALPKNIKCNRHQG